MRCFSRRSSVLCFGSYAGDDSAVFRFFSISRALHAHSSKSVPSEEVVDNVEEGKCRQTHQVESSIWGAVASSSAALASEPLLGTIESSPIVDDKIGVMRAQSSRLSSSSLSSSSCSPREITMGSSFEAVEEEKEGEAVRTTIANTVNRQPQPAMQARQGASARVPTTAPALGGLAANSCREEGTAAKAYAPLSFASSSAVSASSSSTSSQKTAGTIARAAALKAIDMPRIIFFGGDQVSIACLTALCDKMLERLELLLASPSAYMSGGGGAAASISFASFVAELNSEGSGAVAGGGSGLGKDYSVLAPFLEVVCPKAPSIEELEAGGASVHHFSHNHYPVPRFCHKHNLTCHIVDHRASLAKSTLNFDSILFEEGAVTNPRDHVITYDNMSNTAATQRNSASISSSDNKTGPACPSANENNNKSSAEKMNPTRRAVDAAIDQLFGLPPPPSRPTSALSSPSPSSSSAATLSISEQGREGGDTTPKLSRAEHHDVLADHANVKEETNNNSDSRTLRFDVAVVVSFRYFISDELLYKLPPVINVHPSLLPKYRGCSPIFSTMLLGDPVGGASIIKIGPCEAMDSGDVLMQRTIPIAEDEDMRSYFPRLMGLAGHMLGEILLPSYPIVNRPNLIGAPPLPPPLPSPLCRPSPSSSLSSSSASSDVAGLSSSSGSSLTDSLSSEISLDSSVPETTTSFALSSLSGVPQPRSSSSKDSSNERRTSPTTTTAAPALPMPWRSHFNKMWDSAREQSNKVHFKLDPFYAPMIPRHRATYLRFDHVSGNEAYDMWRTFVGGQFFGAVSASLDKRATPVANDLLKRAISKYQKKHTRKNQPKDNANTQPVGAIAAGGELTKESINGTSPPTNVSSAVTSTPPLSAGLGEDIINELMRTHVTFMEAKCPAHVSAATHALLTNISSGALLPGAACFPSTDESIVAIMCGTSSKAKKEKNEQVTNADEHRHHIPEDGHALTADSTRSSHYPNGEIEWFFVKELMLHGSKGPTKPSVLRTSFAMKKDTVYPFLFSTDKDPWTIDLQRSRSQQGRPAKK